MKFWGTCFKFWLRPCTLKISLKHAWFFGHFQSQYAYKLYAYIKNKCVYKLVKFKSSFRINVQYIGFPFKRFISSQCVIHLCNMLEVACLWAFSRYIFRVILIEFSFQFYIMFDFFISGLLRKCRYVESHAILKHDKLASSLILVFWSFT